MILVYLLASQLIHARYCFPISYLSHPDKLQNHGFSEHFLEKMADMNRP